MTKQDLIKLRDDLVQRELIYDDYLKKHYFKTIKANFEKGFDCRDKIDNEALKIAVEALEFYSKIENFEKVVWQDEDKSGPCEPYDFDENELVERYWDGCLGDFGIKAEEALAEIRKLIGEI